MRVGGDTVGRMGAALLAVTAVVGAVLGSHGWSVRHHGVPSALAGPHGPSAPAASRPAAGPSAGPSQGPSASPRPTAATKAGPKLSSRSYASYSFQVWPGTPSAAAKTAEIGLVVKVTRQGSGILVSAGVTGQPLPAATFYPTGAKVYIIEASLGDDSGNSDYNLGDDGLVVTDAQERILQ